MAKKKKAASAWRKNIVSISSNRREMVAKNNMASDIGVKA
jgi:hypothetical protein